MDEWTLNDLLECSVCLERLDTSSKVLPCQHTFCKKCLEEIVSSHKELRCPECRVLVENKVDDLPPNVLLMRILEGMSRNNPRKRNSHYSPGSSGGVESPHTPSHPLSPSHTPLSPTHYNLSHHNSPQSTPSHIPLPNANPTPSHQNTTPSSLNPPHNTTPSHPSRLVTDEAPSNLTPQHIRQKSNELLNAQPSNLTPQHIRQKSNELLNAQQHVRQKSNDLLNTQHPQHIRQKSNELLNAQQHVRQKSNELLNAQQHVRQKSNELLNAQQHYHQRQRSAELTQTPRSSPVSKTGSGVQAFARAIYDYASKEPGDLNFKKGDIVVLRRKIDNNWFYGELNGATGAFPMSYVQIMTPLPHNHTPQCKALYDFRMNNNDEEGCLKFSKGEIISVIRRVDENWAEGRLGDKIGIFPLAFVEMNNVARALMKLSTNSQPGPSRNAPPTPTTAEESTPLISTAPPQSIAITAPVPPVPVMRQTVPSSTATPTSPSSSSSSSTTSPTSTSTSSSDSTPSTPPGPIVHISGPTVSNAGPAVSNTGPAVHSSGPTVSNTGPTVSNTGPAVHSSGPTVSNTGPVAHTSGPALPTPSKRHSFSHLMTQSQPSTPHRYSAEILSSVKEPTNSESTVPSQNSATPTSTESAELKRQPSLRSYKKTSGGGSGGNLPSPSPTSPHISLKTPALYIAIYPYKPQKEDELELRRGSVYTVTERCQDGWYKGTSHRSQRSGVFPGNYVAPAKSLPALQAQLRGLRSGGVNSSSARSSSSPAAISSSSGGGGGGDTSKHSTPKSRPSKIGGVLVASTPPDLPPRSLSPSVTSSWHGTTQETARSSLLVIPPPNVSVPSSGVEKKKEKSSGGGVSLMRRLTNITHSKSKSPPPPCYSMDNPVFEDSSATTLNSPSQIQHVHVRSDSCPSKLLGTSEHRMLSPANSQRSKHKDRPSAMNHFAARPVEAVVPESPTAPQHHHRKSNSLDASSSANKSSSANQPEANATSQTSGQKKTSKQLVPPVRERFRCIVPYPPNSEYELELRVGDLIYVHKKRDDGWYKGTLHRTGRTGLFPASFVETF